MRFFHLKVRNKANHAQGSEMSPVKISALLSILGTLSQLKAQDLQAYWPFEQEVTDQATSGSSSDNATWTGTPSFTGTSPFGDAILLNGSNSLIIPASVDINTGSSNLTFSGWYRLDQTVNTTQTIFDKAPGYSLQLANGSTLTYFDNSGNPSGAIVDDGQWHHFATVSTPGEDAQLFVDGVLIGAGGTSNINDTGGPLTIGSDSNSAGFGWQGGLDELGIFQEPLSANLIAAIYQLGSDTEFEYRLPEVISLHERYLEGVNGDPILVGRDTWIYSATTPNADEIFILLGNDGSGMQLSPGPEVSTFTAVPNIIAVGGDTALEWEIDPSFTDVTIFPSVGNVTSQTNASGIGSITVNPTETIDYTISATNAEGTNIARVTVFVDFDPTAVRINEFVARPANDGELDENGETEDWIELHNPGTTSVNLGTYYLTDDSDDLTKWAIPAVDLAPGNYILIFASGNDLTDNPAFLHTNFSLSGGGEFLALTRDASDGGVEIVNQFSPEYPEQFEGISYGYNSSGSQQGYFITPTPREANGAPTNGFVEDTNFSTTRGFFTAPFELTISTDTPDAIIHYTTDGSAPTETNGSIYDTPITISETTVLRAFAFRSGFEPTNIDTQSYFFAEDIVTQSPTGAAPTDWPSGPVNGQLYDYGMDPEIVNEVGEQAIIDALTEIPSISLVMSQSDLTSTNGIYSNATLRGRDWERPASLELVDPNDGPEEFQINCGVRIRGGASRSDANPKHAFRFFFRSIYGDSKLDFPLFGTEGADEFDRIDMRTAQNYSWSFTGASDSVFNTFLREVLGRDLQGQLDVPYTRSRYYHMYVNGQYWGLFMSQERAGADFGETYLGGDNDDYDTLKSSGNTGGATRYNTEATDGSFAQGTMNAPGSDWARLYFLTQNQSVLSESAREEAYLEMQGLNPDGSRNEDFPVLIDPDNLILYTLIIGYTGNYDAPLSDFVGAANNWFAIRDFVRDDRGFTFFVHDGEHSLGAGSRWDRANDRINTTDGAATRNEYLKYNPGYVHLDLADTTPSYRRRFGDVAHSLLFNDGILTENNVMSSIEGRESIVAQVIDAEAARWGDAKNNPTRDRDDWVNAVNFLKETVDTRTEVFLGHLRQGNLYPETDAPFFTTALRQIDPAQPLFLRHSGNLPIYYTTDGSDPLNSDNTPTANAILVEGLSEVVIPTDQNWEYLDTGDTSLSSSDVVLGHPDYDETDWKHPLFQTTGWENGNGPFTFGSVNGITPNTAISDNDQITTYFRTTVNLNSTNLYEAIANYIADDGFVLYINGQEAIRTSFASGTLVTSTTTSPNATDLEGNSIQEGTMLTQRIDPSFFQAGENIIALELHNTLARNVDLGVLFELSILSDDPATQIFVDEPQEIFSRALNTVTGESSALNAGFFTPGVAANSDNLIITEVNYRPAALTEEESDLVDDRDDFEFIEITNIGSDDIDLGNLAFIETLDGIDFEGLRFTFPLGSLIEGGQSLLIVADEDAFAIRYPNVPTSQIIGEYQGRLGNGSDLITLVDANGIEIASFRYTDDAPFPTQADGDGATLELINATASPDYNDASLWRASIAIGGSPGVSPGLGFIGNPNADVDNDGVSAFLEFFYGTSDSSAADIDTPEAEIVIVDGLSYGAIRFRRSPEAENINFIVENSRTFDDDWTDNTTLFSESTLTDGRTELIYRQSTPITDGSKNFLRLRITQ